jgi:glutamyl-Q tRNA(Asp) synthetase
LATLEAYGLQWDGNVYYQSEHLGDYADYLAALEAIGLTYRCTCSRKSLSEHVGDSANKPVYAGTCRNKQIAENVHHAIRLKTDSLSIVFDDGLQAETRRDLAQQDGDFILKRRDGIIAYQFAVVVDDHLQQINHVVRGYDLLEETPKQIYLQQRLGFNTPHYRHVPVIVDSTGCKLSKQTLAPAADTQTPNKTLFFLLALLRQSPPHEFRSAPIAELLDWAVQNWRINQLAMRPSIRI